MKTIILNIAAVIALAGAEIIHVIPSQYSIYGALLIALCNAIGKVVSKGEEEKKDKENFEKMMMYERKISDLSKIKNFS